AHDQVILLAQLVPEFLLEPGEEPPGLFSLFGENAVNDDLVPVRDSADFPEVLVAEAEIGHPAELFDQPFFEAGPATRPPRVSRRCNAGERRCRTPSSPDPLSHAAIPTTAHCPEETALPSFPRRSERAAAVGVPPRPPGPG